jgi:hypothetical protein
MLMNKIYFVPLMIFFSSCLPHINYLGTSFPPGREPDLFVDEKSIDKPYKIIGKGYPNGVGTLTLKTLQRKAIEKAKKKGADAVLIQDYFVPVTVANSHTTHNTGNGNSLLSGVYNVETRFIILFLKYTEP